MTHKHFGRDCELSTSGLDSQGEAIHPRHVTQRLLAALKDLGPEGLRAWTPRSGVGYLPTYLDSDRRWLSNGMCFYNDQWHVEACTPLERTPSDLAASSIAMLQVADAARRRAEADLPRGSRIHLTAANADMCDPENSWGSHLNVAVKPALWDELLDDVRRPAVLNCVASVIAAAVPLFGSGLLLPTRSGDVIYSTSGRAHHLTRISTLSTMQAYKRGLLNGRCEHHSASVARLHLICFDYTLIGTAPLAAFLGAGLAAAERGLLLPSLLAPVEACRDWSFGFSPGRGQFLPRAALVDGRQVTLPKYVLALAGQLLNLVEQGAIPRDEVLEAERFLPLVIELAEALERGDLQRAARHLDWAAKLIYLRSVCQEPGGAWGDAAHRLADHDFTHVDPERGAFWQFWDRGLVDPHVTPDDVARRFLAPPPHGRDWARAELIRRFGDSIVEMNWDQVALRLGESAWSPTVRIDLPEPDRFGAAEFGPLLDRAATADELIHLLAARCDPPAATGTRAMDVIPPPSGAVDRQEADWGGRSPLVHVPTSRGQEAGPLEEEVR